MIKTNRASLLKLSSHPREDPNFRNIEAAMLPEKLCHAEKMAPGTAASGNMAK